MTEEKIGKIEWFWKLFYDLHLYKTKSEGLFKAIIITLSWCGGVHLSTDPINMSTTIAASFYLFSLALIMEYVVKLVSEKEIVKKILPCLAVLPSVYVLIISCSVLFARPFSNTTYNCLAGWTLFPQLVIWLDVLIQLMIEPPVIKNSNIESTLKNIEMEEQNE